MHMSLVGSCRQLCRWPALHLHSTVILAENKFNGLVSCCLLQARTLLSSAGRLEESATAKNVVSDGSKELHKPVMLKEVIKCLAPQQGQVCEQLGQALQLAVESLTKEESSPDNTFLDMTFGAGGHSKAILQQASDITVYALDRDPVAHQIAHQLAKEHPKQVYPLLGRFSDLQALLPSAGVEPGSLDGVLLDAGCSSMQFDNPERGFSLSKDGPLDMRMDSNRCLAMPSAADVVNALDQQALASILRTYGEERHARKIASAIVQARSIYPITRTQQLASIVAGAFPAVALYARRDLMLRPAHVATKTFQALRIFVNDELNELYAGLRAAEGFLKPGGCLVAVSFHSLEDRIVKRFLHGIDVAAPHNLNVRQKIRQSRRGWAEQHGGEVEEEEEEDDDDNEEQSRGPGSANWHHVQKKVLTPDPQEVLENPRGRSAKLRAARKR
ncbi:probable methyltransferase-like protein 15 isoform X2 [Polyodon spathula]|nr:probable methyltransferase-like protein 15 isoform X2 [Polyodon spathula]